MRYAWIAVALATAIRLYGLLPHSAGLESWMADWWMAAAVLVLAAVACVTGRSRARIAAVFLILAALADLASLRLVQTTQRTFIARRNEHLASDLTQVRRRLTTLEGELDASALRITRSIAGNENDRGALFLILKNEVGAQPKRGARILDAQGEPIAWWGEDYRATANQIYQFDVTNLYVTRTRTTPRLTVQAFERIRNVPNRAAPLHDNDAWVVAMFFHAGFPIQKPGTHRFFVSKHGETSLYVDMTSRPQAELLEAIRAEGTTVSGIILALGALIVSLWNPMWGRLPAGRTAGGSPAVADSEISARPYLAIVCLLVGRVALLPVHAPTDRLGIFGFNIYGSKALGPFSKSPVDLLLTAATILALVLLVRPLLARIWIPVRVAIALAAAWGYVKLIDNFVTNSRISALPDHVVPATAAQAILFTAILFLAFALAALFASIFAGWKIELFARNGALRVASIALIVAAIVFVPLHNFMRQRARSFISESYAPLVAGESGQLLTVISSTLDREFSRIDLATILPDDYRHTNMEDLAYALWLRSNLSTLQRSGGHLHSGRVHALAHQPLRRRHAAVRRGGDERQGRRGAGGRQHTARAAASRLRGHRARYDDRPRQRPCRESRRPRRGCFRRRLSRFLSCEDGGIDRPLSATRARGLRRQRKRAERRHVSPAAESHPLHRLASSGPRRLGALLRSGVDAAVRAAQ